MRGLVKGLEDIFTAVASTEADEHEKAREILAGTPASAGAKVHLKIHPRPNSPLVPEGDS